MRNLLNPFFAYKTSLVNVQMQIYKQIYCRITYTLCEWHIQECEDNAFVFEQLYANQILMRLFFTQYRAQRLQLSLSMHNHNFFYHHCFSPHSIPIARWYHLNLAIKYIFISHIDKKFIKIFPIVCRMDSQNDAKTNIDRDTFAVFSKIY